VTERVLGSYDVVVVGVGAMGSAATYHLARRGQRVLALEQFDVPHEYGSSHGYTRIIRLPYYEDPAYVPLLRRAYGLWRELQAAAGEPLLHITGSIDAGPAESWVFKGALRSAEQFDLPHEVLDSAELTRRWPGYRLPAETLALYQPEGGFLLPERCIVAHVNGALAHGARVQARERVWSVEAAAGGVRRAAACCGVPWRAQPAARTPAGPCTPGAHGPAHGCRSGGAPPFRRGRRRSGRADRRPGGPRSRRSGSRRRCPSRAHPCRTRTPGRRRARRRRCRWCRR